MLKNHTDLPARLPQLPGIHGGQVLAAHHDPAQVRPLQQVDHPYQRGFAGTRIADDAEDLALLDA